VTTSEKTTVLSTVTEPVIYYPPVQSELTIVCTPNPVVGAVSTCTATVTPSWEDYISGPIPRYVPTGDVYFYQIEQAGAITFQSYLTGFPEYPVVDNGVCTLSTVSTSPLESSCSIEVKGVLPGGITVAGAYGGHQHYFSSFDNVNYVVGASADPPSGPAISSTFKGSSTLLEFLAERDLLRLSALVN